MKPLEYKEIIEKLKSLSNPKNVEGMSKFGINTKNALGISILELRKLAKEKGKNHELAEKLWNSKLHEARILSTMIEDPKQVTEKQMNSWIKDFDSWDLCDQCCMNLFYQLPNAYEKAIEWTSKEKEFERRAGFVLMACLAWKDKKTENKKFEQFFPYLKKHSTDERNFVKKAVNWALRQIGKRNPELNKKAIQVAKEIKEIDSKSAKWIANDALRELQSEKVQARLRLFQ